MRVCGEKECVEEKEICQKKVVDTEPYQVEVEVCDGDVPV